MSISSHDNNALRHIIGVNTGSLKVCATINDINAILNLVQDTDMITILTAQSIIGHQHLKAIDVTELSAPVKSYVFFAKDAYRKASALKMLQMFKDIAVPKAKMIMSLT